MDCHVETYRDAGGNWPKYRAYVVHTDSGKFLYVTWPYRSERAARDRATRWIGEERERLRQAAEGPTGLFAHCENRG